MKALIFNSGLGSRLGKLTAKNPKAMVRLGNGETIFGRQLRILYSCGIREFVITTGPYPEQLLGETAPYLSKGCSFIFVPNSIYSQTNYIYSMYRAQEYLRGSDFLTLHGDLVFDLEYAQMVIDSELPSLGSINRSLPQPEKDFKARVIDEMVREVSVKIFDDNCIAFQPFYKLSEEAMEIWLNQVIKFCEGGDVKVYAENAANQVFEKMHVHAHSYADHYVEEVDTPEDLARVSAAIRTYDFAQQPVFTLTDGELVLKQGVAAGALRNAKKVACVAAYENMARPLIVAPKSVTAEDVQALLGDAAANATFFNGFSEEPTFEEVMVGVKTYQVYGCDSIVSVGANNAIDAAKCIKLFAAMPAGAEERYAEGMYDFSPIKHVAIVPQVVAVSAQTNVASCFVDGREVVVEHDCLVPDVAIFA